jgi:phosphate butyryltransferase
MEITDVEEEHILEASASIITDGRADLIMKGMVGTGNFIHVLLDPQWGIRTEEILTHVGMFEIPHTGRVFLLSDAGINIHPNFTRKIAIVLNAVGAARKLGIKNPRVAMLAAVERVQLPAMPATLDAFLMKKYSETGYFGKCEIDGPFAFDNAIDPEKAKTKGIGGKVAGNANVIIVPYIETGNVVWKSITSLQHRDAAGVVLGGRCPIVVPSRSDDYKTKLKSIQFARLLMK